MAPRSPIHGLSVLGAQKAENIMTVPALSLSNQNPKREVVHRTPVNNKTSPLAGKYSRDLFDVIACKKIRQFWKIEVAVA